MKGDNLEILNAEPNDIFFQALQKFTDDENKKFEERKTSELRKKFTRDDLMIIDDTQQPVAEIIEAGITGIEQGSMFMSNFIDHYSTYYEQHHNFGFGRSVVNTQNLNKCSYLLQY